MDAHCRVDTGIGLRHRHRPGGRSGVPARHEQPFDPGLESGLDDGLPIGLERVGLKMGVAVDQAHGNPPGLPRGRGRGLGLQAREERLGGAQAAGIGSVSAPPELAEKGRPALPSAA